MRAAIIPSGKNEQARFTAERELLGPGYRKAIQLTGKDASPLPDHDLRELSDKELDTNRQPVSWHPSASINHFVNPCSCVRWQSSACASVG
jgi:hypothetical protein